MTDTADHSVRTAKPSTGRRAASGPRMRKAYLPYFTGFYQTNWEWILSHSEAMAAEDVASLKSGGSGPDIDRLAAIIEGATDMKRHCALLAQEYCALFDRHLSDAAGFETGIAFRRLISPEWYNFETDRILVDVPDVTVKKLYAASEAEGHRRLGASIAEAFTPYDGYMPFYSSDVADWTGKLIGRWDSNEICTLLDIFVDTDIDDILFGEIAEARAFFVFKRCVDWPKVFQKISAERRSRN